MSELNFKFCPLCATPLIEKQIFDGIRATCPTCDFVQFLDPKLVAVVLVEYKGKLLLGKRNVDPAKGMWNIPGGYVNRGEKVEEAARREIKEETNLEVELEGLLGLYSETDNPHVVAVYQAHVVGNDISGIAHQPEEVSELGFFDPQALPELAFDSENRILTDWRKKRLGKKSG